MFMISSELSLQSFKLTHFYTKNQSLILFVCCYQIYHIFSFIYLVFFSGSKPEYAKGECTNITHEWESDTSQQRCPQEDWTIQAVAAFYMLFSNLLLVNLVIAMFRWMVVCYKINYIKQSLHWSFTRLNNSKDFSIMLIYSAPHHYLRNMSIVMITVHPHIINNWKSKGISIENDMKVPRIITLKKLCKVSWVFLIEESM